MMLLTAMRIARFPVPGVAKFVQAVLPVAMGDLPGGLPMAGQKLMSPAAAAPLPDRKTANRWVVL